MKLKSYLFIISSLFILTACGKDSPANNTTTANTNISSSDSATGLVSGPKNIAEVARGRSVFKDNCQVCHGEKGAGLVKNWRDPLPDGKYPAPPLNGTAHTWHHPESLLLNTINNGGLAIGGTMPAFKDILSDKDKRAVLSYIESLWPEKTYQMWLERNNGK